MKNHLVNVTLCWVSSIPKGSLSFSSLGLPIMKFPGEIQTNFMPMLLVKVLGGSFFCWAWIGKKLASVTKAATRTKQKRRFMTYLLRSEERRGGKEWRSRWAPYP